MYTHRSLEIVEQQTLVSPYIQRHDPLEAPRVAVGTDRLCSTSPSYSGLGLIRIAHAGFLSDRTHCTMMTSKSVCLTRVPDSGSRSLWPNVGFYLAREDSGGKFDDSLPAFTLKNEINN